MRAPAPATRQVQIMADEVDDSIMDIIVVSNYWEVVMGIPTLHMAYGACRHKEDEAIKIIFCAFVPMIILAWRVRERVVGGRAFIIDRSDG
jgi:hypothetical protein